MNWNDASLSIAHDVTALGFGAGTNLTTGLVVALAFRSASGSSPPNTIKLTSADGTSWTTNTPGSDERYEAKFSNIAFGNDRFVATGDTFSGVRGVVSIWGTSWSYTVGGVQGPVAFGNGLFVNAWLFDVKSTGTTVFASTSTNGYIWSSQNYAGNFLRPLGICFNGEKFLTVGQGGQVAISSDGTNWASHVASVDGALRGVDCGGGRFVAVGDAGIIVSSEDGIAWTLRSGGTGRHLNAVSAYGDGFVTAGNFGSLATSTNGLDWHAARAPTTNALRSALHANGHFLFTGFLGTVVSGLEITNLEVRASPTTQSLLATAFGNGVFIAVGANGTVITSIDATNWFSQSLGVQDQLRSIAFGNGSFVAVGDSGSALVSPNGTNWTKHEMGGFLSLSSITYGNGRFVAVTGFLSSGPVVSVVTSTDGIIWDHVRGIFPVSGVTFGSGLFLTADNSPGIYVSSDGLRWDRYAISVNAPVRTALLLTMEPLSGRAVLGESCNPIPSSG